MAEINLTLDVDFVGHDESREEVARVCVASACRFTRNGGAPTISADCPDLRTLESEIARLKAELDDVATRARQHFGEKAQTQTRAVPASAVADHSDHISPGDQLVRDVMTKNVLTLRRNDELSLAKELMDVGHFRHVVVLDDEDHVAGVISRQDIHYGALAWSMGLSESIHDKTLSFTTAKAVMRSQVVTIAPEASLMEAARIMVDKKIGCLPVLDGVQLVGILTEGDLLALLAD